MQSFVGNFCNNVFATELKFCMNFLCENVLQQPRMTSNNNLNPKFTNKKFMILQSHMSTGRGAHFTSLGELEATVFYCLNLFKCYPSLSNHFPRQHKTLHSFNKLRVAFQFLTTWTSDKDGKLPLIEFQGWQGNSSSIEVFSCGYIFGGVRGKQVDEYAYNWTWLHNLFHTIF